MIKEAATLDLFLTPQRKDSIMELKKKYLRKETLIHMLDYPLDKDSDIFDFFLQKGFLPRLATTEENEWLFCPAHIDYDFLKDIDEKDIGNIREGDIQPHDYFGIFVKKNAEGAFVVRLSIDDWNSRRQDYHLRQKQGVLKGDALKMFLTLHDDIENTFYEVYKESPWKEVTNYFR